MIATYFRLAVRPVFTIIVLGCAAFAQSQPTADLGYQTAAVLYMQKSAEYRALAYQAFNLARLRLESDLDKKNLKQLPKEERKRPRAIVVDIDETVLDNSPSQANSIRTGRPFNTNDWYAWGEMRKAKAIPGAVDFLNYAVAMGVKVFYISNRDEVQKQATIDNLLKVGFKDVSNENVLLRQTDASGRHISPKGPRRESVLRGHRVVMLIGDNLDDFSDVFERKNVSERFAETEKAIAEWGRKWIVLPNAMYGTWENAIYDYKAATMPEQEKAAKRASALELP
jgi:5'-nucleotidase (lipoprotein e(P4) family)